MSRPKIQATNEGSNLVKKRGQSFWQVGLKKVELLAVSDVLLQHTESTQSYYFL